MLRGARRAATPTEPVEGPWALPEGWRWERAAEIANIVGGGTPRNAADPLNYDPAGTPWITPADLSGYDRAIIGRGARSLSEQGLKRSAARVMPAGTVLISSRAPVGYCAVASRPVATNQGFKSLVLRDGIDPFFVRYYVLRSKQYLQDNSSGTTFKELSGSAMGELMFPLAPLDVQHRIVARIDALFAEIEEGEQALAAATEGLEAYRKALFKAAVTGDLTADWRKANPPAETGQDLMRRVLADRRARWEAEPSNTKKHYNEPAGPGSDERPNLPERWAWTRLEQLGEVVRGASPRPAGHPRYFGGTIPWITVGSITRDNGIYLHRTDTFLTEEGRQKSRFIQPGTFLLTNSGFTLGVPKISMIGGCINDGVVAINILDEDVKVFLYFYLSTKTEELRNIRRGQDQPNLNTSIVKDIRVPIPPVSEIRQINRLLLDCGDRLVGLEPTLRGATRGPALRQAILAAAFRGDLAV